METRGSFKSGQRLQFLLRQRPPVPEPEPRTARSAAPMEERGFNCGNERGVLSLQSDRLRLFLVRFRCLHVSLAEISAIIYSTFRDAFTRALNENVVNTSQSQCSY